MFVSEIIENIDAILRNVSRNFLQRVGSTKNKVMNVHLLIVKSANALGIGMSLWNRAPLMM